MFNEPKIIATLMFIAAIAVLGIGILIVASAKRMDLSKTMAISVNALIGIVFIVIGAGGIGLAVLGQGLIKTILQIEPPE